MSGALIPVVYVVYLAFLVGLTALEARERQRLVQRHAPPQDVLGIRALTNGAGFDPVRGAGWSLPLLAAGLALVLVVSELRFPEATDRLHSSVFWFLALGWVLAVRPLLPSPAVVCLSGLATSRGYQTWMRLTGYGWADEGWADDGCRVTINFRGGTCTTVVLQVDPADRGTVDALLASRVMELRTASNSTHMMFA